MENVPEYIARKFGLKEIDYLHPSLEKLLTETFGIIVYQEQVMEIAKILAGYSLAQADLLRRAMGKKIKEEMDVQKEFFINGAMKNGIQASKADYIFELVAKFAGYGFNKSHATAYAIISYYTAWLKTHYKLEFFTALFNLEIQNTDKLGILKADANSHDVKILPPCVLKSEIYFLIDENENGLESIRYGLYAIKNVGEFVAESIIESRVKNGEFSNLFDFLKRFNNKVLNKKSLESLIKSGALDLLISKTNSSLGLNLNRSSLLNSVTNLIDFINKNHESSNQISLFSSFDDQEKGAENVFERPDILILKELSEPELALNEFEAIGFYLDKNPMMPYSGFLKKNNTVSCLDSSFLGHGQTIYMAGAISGIHIRSSKRGKFANLTIVDESGLSELFIYDGQIIEENMNILKPGNLIFIHVKGLGEKKNSQNSFLSQDSSSGSVRLIVQTLSDLKKIAINSKSVFQIDLNDEFIENFEQDDEFQIKFQKLLGEFIHVNNNSDSDKKTNFENFPNFNTYFIFKIFSSNKFHSSIEIKPKLAFKDSICFTELREMLKNQINGFIDLKKIF
jgi:DNA polymerase-3 subunit alpha